MVKQVASLMLASICLLAFLDPASATDRRWGWSDLNTTQWTELKPVSPTAHGWLPATKEVSVVAVNLDPKATKVPGVLAKVWPALKDALDSVKRLIGNDPTLKASLDTHGVSPDAVIGIGIGEGAGGKLTIFVSSAA